MLPERILTLVTENPNWRAALEQNFKLERLPKWPENGHSQTTIDFNEKNFSAPNLKRIYTEHIHRSAIEMIKGKLQIVSDDNVIGGNLSIYFLPLEKKIKS